MVQLFAIESLDVVVVELVVVVVLKYVLLSYVTAQNDIPFIGD